jgi:hypothetical protein
LNGGVFDDFHEERALFRYFGMDSFLSRRRGVWANGTLEGGGACEDCAH